MFEKFSTSDIDSAGRGGEYTVQVWQCCCIPLPHLLTARCLTQAGFGWTNGVLLWVASTYGDILVAPQCPDLLAQVQTTTSPTTTATGAGTSSTASGNQSTNSASAFTVSSFTVLMGVTVAALLNM